MINNKDQPAYVGHSFSSTLRFTILTAIALTGIDLTWKYATICDNVDYNWHYRRHVIKWQRQITML